MSNEKHKTEKTLATGDDLHERLIDRYELSHCLNFEPSDFIEDYAETIVAEERNDLEGCIYLDRSGGNRAKRGRVPSQGAHALPDGPPITNRGVSKYQSPNSEDPQPYTLQRLTPTDTPPEILQSDGYDGGIQIGFEGLWDAEKFVSLIANLETAKQQASESSQSVFTTIGGVDVLVEPGGANEGLHYKYQFTFDGVRFLIHHKPPQDRQGVRVRYGACSLIGRDLFSLHGAVVAFLASLGFTIVKETLSRIDMQIMLDCRTKDLVLPILNGHAVAKVRKDVLYRNGGKIETYTLGGKDRVQLCIYDKRNEMLKSLVSDPIKFELMVEHCIGDEWFASGRPITRVEFRFGREALKSLGIDTVQDLQERETALTEWATSHWFRILEKPKVRGHENTAAIHPLWRKVQEAFHRWFSSAEDDGKPVEWIKREPVSADPVPLIKQGVGCFASAVAMLFGTKTDVEKTLDSTRFILESYKIPFVEKANERAAKYETIKGVSLGLHDECVLTDSRETFEQFFVRQNEKEVA